MMIVLLAVVLLVAMAGAFAAADAAISSVSSARISEMVRAGRAGAGALAGVVADRPRHVNLILLLRMIAELAATVIAAGLAARWIDPSWLAGLVAVAVMTVVSYVLIGVGPRTLGRQHPYRIGLVAALPVRSLALLLGPLSRLLILVGNAITPGRGFREGPFSSEIELRELVDLAQQRGVVAPGQRQMIHSVFELETTLAREVMVPRTELVWIERYKSLRQALSLSLRTGYSRLPVIGESADDVVGVVNLKDLVRAVVELGTLDSAQTAEVKLDDLTRPPNLVPETKKLGTLLPEMQREKQQMVILVDEYGGVSGMVTIEDVLEEIVGEITDEYDSDEQPPVEELAPGRYRVTARLSVEDLGELFDMRLVPEDVETVGGLVAQRLGRVPLPGAEAEVEGLLLRAEGGKDRRGRMRVRTVVVRRADPGEDPDRAWADGDPPGSGDPAGDRSDRQEGNQPTTGAPPDRGTRQGADANPRPGA